MKRVCVLWTLRRCCISMLARKPTTVLGYLKARFLFAGDVDDTDADVCQANRHLNNNNNNSLILRHIFNLEIRKI